MLALLSSPVRRFVLMALLIPAVAFVLVKVAGFLERRNDGRTTKTSRVLLSASGFLRRVSGRREQDEPQNAALPA
ncbi:MAG: hypothetical protein ACXWZL_05335 [Mycobacterium sp.]|jgi:hypothetical protein